MHRCASSSMTAFHCSNPPTWLQWPTTFGPALQISCSRRDRDQFVPLIPSPLFTWRRPQPKNRVGLTHAGIRDASRFLEGVSMSTLQRCANFSVVRNAEGSRSSRTSGPYHRRHTPFCGRFNICRRFWPSMERVPLHTARQPHGATGSPSSAFGKIRDGCPVSLPASVCFRRVPEPVASPKLCSTPERAS